MGLDGCSDVKEFEWLKPVLRSSRLVYIGLRDLDEGERKILKEHDIKCFTMYHVDKFGIGQVVDMALDAVNPNRDRPVHLSFDVDALDPSVAPSTGTAVRGGLTFREGHYICEALAETGLLVSVDIMVRLCLSCVEQLAQQVATCRKSILRSAPWTTCSRLSTLAVA